jgi:iron complex outermembrane recepter protein
LRATAGRSFRLPTLYETRQPLQLARLEERLDDPLLCPGGQPAPGVDAGQACARHFLRRSGGPVAYGQAASTLAAERTQHTTLGLLVEPNRHVAISLDLWRIRLSRRIDGLSPELITANPSLQARHIVRCRQLGAAARAITDCLGQESSDRIAYIDTPLANQGRIDSRGADLAFVLRSAAAAQGEFSLAFNGSYIAQHLRQAPDSLVYENWAGRYADDQALPRWQHAWQAGWSLAPWSAALSQRSTAGYEDAEGGRRVAAYSLLDLSAAWEAETGLRIELGLHNLLARRPPFSNQADTAQANHDPRLTDPLGRALSLRLRWQFR